MEGRANMRERGTGSISRRKNGLYVVRVELPNDGHGRRRKQRTATTRARAIAILREMRRELDASGDLPTSSPTVETWANLWHQRVTPTLKPRTAQTYRGYIDTWIVPTIGRVRLEKVTTHHVYRVHDAITAAGKSSTTALQAHAILRKMLGDAEREGRIGRNPAALAVAPRRAVAVRPALTAEQALTLLRSEAANPYAVHWTLALLAGLRQGERLGVTAGALDLAAGTLVVEWQVQRLKAGTVPPPSQESVHLDGGLWLTRPKSRAGWREVPVVGLLHDVLARHLSTTPPAPSGLIFHRDGRPLDPRQDATEWADALERAGLPRVPLHSARHTCSSLLAHLGVAEHVRMQMLGHSSATVTRGYTHLTGAEARDGAERLGRLLDWRASVT